MPGLGDRGQFDTGTGILVTEYMIEEWELPSGLVLLNGDGHWWIALDYRHSGVAGPPTVVWIDVEREEDLQLAPSFEDFVAGLVPANRSASTKSDSRHWPQARRISPLEAPLGC